MEKFYMVFVEGKSSPTRVYSDILEAEKEAMRLCELQRARSFVLVSEVMFELKNVVRTVIS